MRFIIAVIRPHKLDDVRNALTPLGVDGMTVTEVKGFGRQRGHKQVYRGAEYNVDFTPKLKIEIAVTEELVVAAVTAIRDAAHTGHIGDGKVFVIDLVDAMRVRTGEIGPTAL